MAPMIQNSSMLKDIFNLSPSGKFRKYQEMLLDMLGSLMLISSNKSKNTKLFLFIYYYNSLTLQF